MARLRCFCGHSMSTVDSRTPNILNVYRTRALHETAAKEPELLFHDYYFEQLDRDVEVWFCDACERIYLVEGVGGGRILETFALAAPDESIRHSDWTRWEEYSVFTEAMAEDIGNEDLSLTDAIAKNRKQFRWFFDPVERRIVALHPESGVLEKFYQEEVRDL